MENVAFGENYCSELPGVFRLYTGFEIYTAIEILAPIWWNVKQGCQFGIC